jgi:hypothetical protein
MGLDGVLGRRMLTESPLGLRDSGQAAIADGWK